MAKPKKSHPTIVRERTFKEFICQKKGCKFYGERTVQGVCHTTEPFYGGSWDYIDRGLRFAFEFVREEKKLHGKTPAAWIRYLEAAYATTWCNATFNLDELIRLRRDNALLRHKLKARK